MRVTQQDIAKIAEVSQATVSRVLAGDTRVEPDTRTKVLAVIEQANYQPDVRAQSLRRKRTGLIGLVIKRERNDAIDDPFVASLVTCLTRSLSGSGYHLCMDHAFNADDQSRVYDEMLRSRRVDGMIILEPEAQDARLDRLDRDEFPFVVIGNPQRPTWHSVDNDNVGAAYMATTHLIKQGHKAIGFLAGPAGLAVTEERTKGYLAALEEHNMPGHVWNCDFGHSAAHCKTSDLIADGLLMPAYLVMDDYMATGFIKAVQEAGFQIPSDCAITSFNDSSLCHLLPHGLTSVNMGVPALVQMAVDQLIAIVESKEHLPARRTLVACELKIRGSSRSGGQP